MENLIGEHQKLEEKIRRLKLELMGVLLDKELEAIPIDVLANAWKIGERTLWNLRYSGYRTLKDLKNIHLLRYSMPECMRDVWFNSIRRWVQKEKE